MSNLSCFWERVDQLRKSKNLKWADIANACNLPRATISGMKRWATLPDYQVGCTIRDILETSDSFLLKGGFRTPKNPDLPEHIIEGLQKVLSHKLGIKILEGLTNIPNEQYFSILAIAMAFHADPESLVR